MSTWTSPITWVNGAVTASQMNAEIRDHFNYVKAALDNTGIVSDVGKSKLTPALVGARVFRASNQAIASSGPTEDLFFPSERFDSDAFHETTVDDSKITIPTGMDGYYLIGAHVGWAGNATGFRRVRLIVNNTTHIASTQGVPVTADAFLQSVNTVYQFAAGDYIRVRVFQNSGVSLDVSATAADGAEFWIHRLSST